MDLLIIGNGFDLAHGLPTRYTDFLRYCREYNEGTPISVSNELNEEFISFVKEMCGSHILLIQHQTLITPEHG
jgi:hypothetical protein